MSKGFILFLLLFLVGLTLAGCGSDITTTTPITNLFAGPSTAIPTYTPAPATALPQPTISPTPIVVLPTSTPPPTATPVPTATPKPPPTATPFPTQPPRPTTALPTPTGQTPYREISPEQARNLKGYRALLPTYLPTGYKLIRISYSEIPGSNIISLIGEFATDKPQTQTFYLNTQYLPASTPVPTATPVPPTTGSPLVTPVPTPTLPPLKTGPFPTVAPGIFRQDTVRVRGQAGLLSYSSQFTSLSWTETTSSYALNGFITPDEALKVAESLH